MRLRAVDDPGLVGSLEEVSFLYLSVFFSRRMEKLLSLSCPWLMEESLGSPELPGHSCSFCAGLLGWLLDLGVLFSVPAQWTNTNIPGACRGGLAAVGCWFWLGLSPAPSGAPLPWLGLQMLWVNKSHPLQQVLGYLCLCFLLSHNLWEISIQTWAPWASGRCLCFKVPSHPDQSGLLGLHEIWIYFLFSGVF